MTNILVLLLARSAFVLIAIAFVAALVLTVRQVRGPWWPTLIFQLYQRPAATRLPLWGSLAMVIAIAGLAGGPAWLMTGVVLWAIVAPRHIARYASRRAWFSDKAIEDQENARRAEAEIARTETDTAPKPAPAIADERPVRLRAAAVRNRIRERLEEPPIDSSEPWNEYIMDAAKADREKAYQAAFEDNDFT